MNLSIIGGDYRTVKLIELIAKDNNQITVFGFDKCEELYNSNNIIIENDIDKAILNSNIVIGPVPMTKNQNSIIAKYTDKEITIKELIKCVSDKLFISGNLPNDFQSKDNYIDILKDERYTILNAIATAEGTIEIAMKETLRTIFNSNILVIGYGRIGKILTDRLKGLRANIYCSARGKDLTWIESFGVNSVNYEDFDKKLNMFDIIINTVPVMILNKDRLKLIRKDAVIIDVASLPGGTDFESAKDLGLKTYWELGIPGRMMPLSAAESLKDAIYRIIRERGENK